MTHIYDGKWLFVLSAIAFTVAVTNSYVCNRIWTFRESKVTRSKYPLFYLLTLIGWAISTEIIVIITTHIAAPFGMSRLLWLNVANVIALGFSIVWNFTAYSQIVFRAPAVEAAD